MKYIGAHVSIAGGIANAPANAAALGATAFSLFTKNQRQWQAPEVTPEESSAFREACAGHGFTPAAILPHDSYLINLAQPDPEKRRAAVAAFTAELRRCRALGLDKLNFHPGSNLGKTGTAEGIRAIAEGVRSALDEVEGVTAVFENTAGQGSTLGRSFEELAAMLEATDRPDRVGVCLDSCHAAAAGYDLVTAEGIDAFFARFAELIGFEHLRGMHLNDAKGAVGSRLDRHAPLGDGVLGWEFFRRVMRDPRFDGIPLVLETPEPERWPEEIAELRRLAEGTSAGQP